MWHTTKTKAKCVNTSPTLTMAIILNIKYISIFELKKKKNKELNAIILYMYQY